MSFKKQKTAEMAWASTVARATPATPGSFSPATNQMSMPMFSTVASTRKARAEKESPRPRRMPENIL